MESRLDRYKAALSEKDHVSFASPSLSRSSKTVYVVQNTRLSEICCSGIDEFDVIVTLYNLALSLRNGGPKVLPLNIF